MSQFFVFPFQILEIGSKIIKVYLVWIWNIFNSISHLYGDHRYTIDLIKYRLLLSFSTSLLASILEGGDLP